MSHEKLALIFALKHLHIQFSPDDLSSAGTFNRNTCLMQNDVEIPEADDNMVGAFLQANNEFEPADETMLELARMSLPDWPDAAVFAFEGFNAYGPGDADAAKARVHDALSIDRNCKLARQLLRMLSAKEDLRCAFGTDASSAPDVPRILNS